MLDNSDYMEMLVEEVSLFSSSDGSAWLVTAGEIDAFEMADRAFMVLAGRFGLSDLNDRLAEADMCVADLPLRVIWCGVGQSSGQLVMGPRGFGEPITVLPLANIALARELGEPI